MKTIILMMSLIAGTQALAQARMAGGCGWVRNYDGNREYVCSKSSPLPSRPATSNTPRNTCRIDYYKMTYELRTFQGGAGLMESQPGVMGYEYQWTLIQDTGGTIKIYENQPYNGLMMVQRTHGQTRVTLELNNQVIFSEQPCL